MTKTCRKCGAEKNLEEFYRHAQMADGHLNICKDCVKERVLEHRAANLERIQAYDRERGQLTHRKAANRARAAQYNDADRVRRSRAKHPDAYRAYIAVQNALKRGDLKAAPCERCGYAVGVHAHHEDYSKPLDVVWLCRNCHGERHREINEERRKAS